MAVDIIARGMAGNSIPKTMIGEPGGLSTLNSSGKVPATQLPSYVDSIEEYSSLSDFPETGEEDVIYVAANTQYVYRWTGSSYLYINGFNESEDKAYLSLDKITDYLYLICFNEIDYPFAYEYLKETEFTTSSGGCTSVRNGNWYGRNFDWTYDDKVEFIVYTPRVGNRYASMSVTSPTLGFTGNLVDSGDYSDLYKMIPFVLADGINEKHVVCNINVVPTDKGTTTGTVPAIEEKVELCTKMIVRFVLDNFASAKEAVEYIRDYVKLYSPASLLNIDYEIHLMVADPSSTYILETVNNVVNIIDVSEDSDEDMAGKSYMTNFHLSGITLNDDGTVYTPETQTGSANAIDTNGITEYGSGLERYNLVVENFDGTNSKTGMRNLMSALTYTNAYKTTTTPYWYTEFVGGDLKVNSDVSDFEEIVLASREAYSERARDDEVKTWQTTHSTVYDIDNLSMTIIIQEDEIERPFELNFLQDARDAKNNLAAVYDYIDSTIGDIASALIELRGE